MVDVFDWDYEGERWLRTFNTMGAAMDWVDARSY